MPLTDFLKTFLQKLPENVQYLGTDVAPLMGNNWQQNLMEMQRQNMQLSAAQQQQENWEKSFGAQQAQYGTQNQLEQGRLFSQLLEKGFLPEGARPPQAGTGGQGGPGLYGDGKESNFGAASGAATAPSLVPRSPDPSNMSSIAPFLSMLQGAGQQQSGGQSVNAGNQVPSGQMSPASRMPGMSGDSGGGGGATVPSAGIPIPGLPGRPMIPPAQLTIPLHPDVAKAWPGLAAQYPNGLPAAMHEKLQPEFDKILSNAARDTNQTKDTQSEVLLQSQIAALGGTGSWREVAKNNPQLFAKAQAAAEEIQHPELAAQRRAAEQALADKHKLNEVQKNNATSFWARVKDDPSAWYDKTEEKSTRDYAQDLAKQRGEEMFIPKKPLEGVRQQSEAFALDVLSGNNKLRDIAKELLVTDPNAFGVMMGRWNESMAHLGAPVGNSPRANYLINAFLDNINPLLARDTKQLSGGRAAIQMMNMLKQSFPTLHTNHGGLAAAFDTAEGIAKNTIRDNRLFSYGITDPKKYYPGEAVGHSASGQTYHFKQYTPDGKVEMMEGQ